MNTNCLKTSRATAYGYLMKSRSNTCYQAWFQTNQIERLSVQLNELQKMMKDKLDGEYSFIDGARGLDIVVLPLENIHDFMDSVSENTNITLSNSDWKRLYSHIVEVGTKTHTLHFSYLLDVPITTFDLSH